MAIIIGTEIGELLVGSAGDDEIQGLGGNDVIRALEGADLLYGDGGDDFLVGGLGDDLIDGGAGGFDRAGYGNTIGGVTVDLRLQGVAQDTGAQGFDTLVDIEFLSGSNFDDVLIGDAADNFLWGVLGSDTISGNEGNDLIVAATGNHQLDGGSGIDTWSAFVFGFNAPNGGVTFSLLQQGAAQDTGQGLVNATGFENLNGTSFDDTLIGDGDANTLAGVNGDDRLIAGEGNDFLLGDGTFTIIGPIFLLSHLGFVAGGDDVLEGGEGHDTLIGGGGDDLLSGGEGHDRFIFGDTIGDLFFDSGHDVITDFQKKDVIQFQWPGVDDFSDLTIVEDGDNVVISWGTGADSITLEGFQAKHLSAENFDFGALEAAMANLSVGHSSGHRSGLADMDFWIA